MRKVEELESWISTNSDSDASEYESKQKQLESLYNPIMQRAYQGGNSEGRCDYKYQQEYQQNKAGPSTDEVDWTYYWYQYIFFYVFILIFYKINSN